MTLIDAPRRAELLHHTQGRPAPHRRRLGWQHRRRWPSSAAMPSIPAASRTTSSAPHAADLEQNRVASNSATRARRTARPAAAWCWSRPTPSAACAPSSAPPPSSRPRPCTLRTSRARASHMEGYLAVSLTGLQAALGRASASRARPAWRWRSRSRRQHDPLLPRRARCDGRGRARLPVLQRGEAQVWTGLQEMPDVAAALASLARVVCITRGSRGSLVLDGGAITAIAGAGHPRGRQQRRGRHVRGRLPVRRQPRRLPARPGRAAGEPMRRRRREPAWQPVKPSSCCRSRPGSSARSAFPPDGGLADC